jgi:hypothetical protein
MSFIKDLAEIPGFGGFEITGGSETGIHSPFGDHPKGKAFDFKPTPEQVIFLKAALGEGMNSRIKQICGRNVCRNCPEGVCKNEPEGVVHISIN